MNEPTLETSIPGGSNRPWIVAGAIGFALVTLLMGIRWWSILAQSRIAAAPRIVVLPLAVRDPAWAARANGLTREIAHELEGRSGLKVVSGGLVPQGAARGREPRQIGIDFGAAWVLGGELAVAAGDERVRVALRLLRVGDGAEVWSADAERVSGELLGWPAEIAGEVAAQIAAD